MLSFLFSWIPSKVANVGLGYISIFFKKSWQQRKRKLRIIKLEMVRQLSYDTHGLRTITGFDVQQRQPSDIRTTILGDVEHYIEFPQPYRKEVEKLLPDFEFRKQKSHIFIESMNGDARKVIPDLDDLIDKKRFEAAKIILTRIRNAARTFNGVVYHAAELSSGRRKQKSDINNTVKYSSVALAPSATDNIKEIPTLRMTLYKTDYFTLLTLFETFKEVRNRPEVRQQWAERNYPDSLRLLFTGVGLNCLVCAVNSKVPAERVLLFRKRSARVMLTAATGLYHVTANEALSETDIVDGEVLFHIWIKRALKEEVGIESFLGFDILGSFLYLEDMQPGFTVIAYCTFDFSKLESMIAKSKDGLMEYGDLKALPLDQQQIEHCLMPVPGLLEEDKKVPFSAIAENILRNIDAEGVEAIEARLELYMISGNGFVGSR